MMWQRYMMLIYLFINSHSLEVWAGKLDANKHESTVKIVEASKRLVMDKVESLEDMPIMDGIDPARLYEPHTWSDSILAADKADIIAKQLAMIKPKHHSLLKKC